MAAIDDVLDRLRDDEAFRTQLERDPAGALDGYELSADDLGRLVDEVVAGADPDEQRTARSAFFALVARRAAEERSRKQGPAPDQPS